MVIDSNSTTPLHIFKIILYFVSLSNIKKMSYNIFSYFFFSTLFHLNFYKNSAT